MPTQKNRSDKKTHCSLFFYLACILAITIFLKVTFLISYMNWNLFFFLHYKGPCRNHMQIHLID